MRKAAAVEGGRRGRLGGALYWERDTGQARDHAGANPHQLLHARTSLSSLSHPIQTSPNPILSLSLFLRLQEHVLDLNPRVPSLGFWQGKGREETPSSVDRADEIPGSHGTRSLESLRDVRYDFRIRRYIQAPHNAYALLANCELTSLRMICDTTISRVSRHGSNVNHLVR